MKPPAFQYFRAASAAEAAALLAQHGDAAKILAGGQSLVPVLNFRLAAPSALIDINRAADLAYIREGSDGLHIGALTRQRHAERDLLVRRHAPLLGDALPYIAHPQIRNRGTLGGSLAHADPAAELPAVALTLGARLRLQSAQGERWLEARDFFTGFFTTALQPDELLAEIHIPPMKPRTGWAFDEVSRRKGDYALAGACAMLTLDERGHIHEARLTLLGVSGGPVASTEAARVLVGAEPSAEAFRAAAEAIDGEIEPGSDIHASADFRRHLAKVLATRVLAKAVDSR